MARQGRPALDGHTGWQEVKYFCCRERGRAFMARPRSTQDNLRWDKEIAGLKRSAWARESMPWPCGSTRYQPIATLSDGL